MSSTTWTPTELSSEAGRIECGIWRMVEAQHVVATAKIVDNLVEQELLEDILEESKPPVPEDAVDLDYLLSSPFRYTPLHPKGSRFRGVNDAGVFYGAETTRTAAAEVGYWRWCFLQDTAGLERLSPCAFTAFSVPIRTDGIDLRKPPFDVQAGLWRHPTDYSATQALGRTARDAGLGAIIYESVRDAEARFCAAVLTPAAFAAKKPDNSCQTWMLTVTPEEAIWTRRGGDSFSFKTASWI